MLGPYTESLVESEVLELKGLDSRELLEQTEAGQGRFAAPASSPGIAPLALVALRILGDVREVLEGQELLVCHCWIIAFTYHLKEVILFGHNLKEQGVTRFLNHLNHLSVAPTIYFIPVDADNPVTNIESGHHSRSLILD